jgi:chromosome segregation ATPase
LRSIPVLAFLAVLGVAALPVGALAGKYAYGFDDNEHDRLGWAIVSGDNTSMSDMGDLDDMDRLKSEYGREFLYVRLGKERYVIRDRGLMARVERAAEPVRKAGKELGEVARAQAQYALGDVGDARRQARLARRIARLSREISRRERRDESAEDLEREQEKLQNELDELTSDREREMKTRHEQKNRSARTEDASERVQKAADQLRREIRAILRDAKARHLAERVD